MFSVLDFGVSLSHHTPFPNSCADYGAAQTPHGHGFAQEMHLRYSSTGVEPALIVWGKQIKSKEQLCIHTFTRFVLLGLFNIVCILLLCLEKAGKIWHFIPGAGKLMNSAGECVVCCVRCVREVTWQRQEHEDKWRESGERRQNESKWKTENYTQSREGVRRD